jgi:hypothetical protein
MSLPAEIGKLASLKTSRLQRNRFEHLPMEIMTLKRRVYSLRWQQRQWK